MGNSSPYPLRKFFFFVRLAHADSNYFVGGICGAGGVGVAGGT